MGSAARNAAMEERFDCIKLSVPEADVPLSGLGREPAWALATGSHRRIIRSEFLLSSTYLRAPQTGQTIRARPVLRADFG
ncbi:hypothetical protein NUH86_18995 [Sphingobium sp. JS3065]|uniref:hypothetical protein n=1 Tax=Sphingobium sp. JS3065 TaxID=2970925 RepID=UPI002263D579|nr:hypothetical protein [Sphingobium sp. JS3065]UZW57835.1 hypothetical protein NUH86_18995 [Sphingobium sp. JS3065]